MFLFYATILRTTQEKRKERQRKEKEKKKKAVMDLTHITAFKSCSWHLAAMEQKSHL